MREWWSKILAVFSRERLRQDLHDEMEAHLEMEIQENLARGMPEEKAREEARRRFGNSTLIHEDADQAWAFTRLETLLKDLKYSVRMAGKSPGFVIAAVLTLALGIGGITAMFTVIRTELLTPLDYPDPDRLVDILVSGARQGQPNAGFNLIRYREMQTASSFSGVAASGIPETATLSGGHVEPESIREARVSANFLDVLGVKPAVGRSFFAAEDKPGGPNVAMIGDALWRRRFGGNPNIAGTSVSLGAASYTIVGVLPAQFEYPAPGYDVWVTRPWEWSEVLPERWERVQDLHGLGRLKPGVSLSQARTQLNLISSRYASDNPGLPDADLNGTMRVERLQDLMVRNFRTLLWMLFGAGSLVLLIVCANIASLLLARSTARLREFAVRSSLGAARSRLMQQTLVESISLSLIGGLLSLPLAGGTLAVMLRQAGDVPRAAEIHIDGVVLAFTAAVSILTGLVFGFAPAWRISRTNLTDLLREQGGNVSVHNPALRFSAQRPLVIAQVCLSVALLAGASLLMQSFVQLRNVNPGFDPERLLTMEIVLPPSRYDTNEKKLAFWDVLIKRAVALPGVAGAAVARSLPSTVSDVMALQIDDQPRKEPNKRPLVNRQAVTPDYFSTLGIPLVQGRTFTLEDRTGRAGVAVINDTLARRFWPGYPNGPSPLGHHIIGGQDQVGPEIVGIVPDIHEDGLASDIKPEVYFPAFQSVPQSAYLVVRTLGTPESVISAIRGQVIAIDSSESIANVQRMTQLLNARLGGPRTAAIMLTSFAGISLVVTLIGIYGVIAYLVVERTQEFVIRQALGAERGQILKLVVGRGLRLMVIGLAIGNLIGAGAAQMMRGMLFHVSAGDPRTFALISVLFLIVGLAACYVPARSATRTNLASILR